MVSSGIKVTKVPFSSLVAISLYSFDKTPFANSAVFSFFFRHFRTVAGLSSFVAQMASFPLDLSNMEMTELPEYVFENDTEKEKVPIAKKYNLSSDSDEEDDDCGNCSL